jgi:hypothetical protein
MHQLSKSELKSIITELKDHTFRSRKEKLKEIIDRIDRLRRNLFVSGGAVATFLLAGISVESINIGVVRGTVENPFVIPAALSIAFGYYFYMYWLLYGELKKNFNFRVSIKRSYLEKIAGRVVTLMIDKHWDNKKGSSIMNGWQNPNHKEPDTFSFDPTFDHILNDNKLREIKGELSKIEGFGGNQNKLIFEYKMSDIDRAVLARQAGFSKNMDSIKMMDYRAPLFFGLTVSGIIVYHLGMGIWKIFF